LDVDQIVARIEAILSETGSGREEELVHMMMQLYGAGLARAIEIVKGTQYAEQLADDRLFGSLLLLHDLHPLDAETRVRRMLEKLERSFDSHFLLAGIDHDVATIRVEQNGTRLPSGIAEVIERAAMDVAPDLAGVKIEGLPAEPLVQIAPALGR
jgi:hypothetical protein